MHELFSMKVPETLDSKAFMHPVTIMTRAPVGVLRNTFVLKNRHITLKTSVLEI
jgi:hypothetical protein